MFRIVNTASRKPGKCALSGDSSGPFIDTGKDIKRYGRVYLSIKFFDEPLRELGYIGPGQTSELEKRLNLAENQNEELLEIQEKYEELIEAVLPYVPVPEPKRVPVKETTVRAPSDDEIAQWIRENGKDHPIILAAGSMEKGSTEEWFALYRDKHAKPKQDISTKELQAQAREEEAATPQVEEEGPPKIITVMDQEVDLDKLLAENAKTVVSVAEGKSEEFIAALVRREWFLAETKGNTPRKGVLQPLEYWDEETNEPLIPEDEEAETVDLTEGAS